MYCIPSPFGTLTDDLILFIDELPTKHRILIVGDLNHDEMLPEKVAKATL